MKFFAKCCLALLLPFVAGAQGASKGAITIGAIDSMPSAILKETRRFLIYTPLSYHDSTYLPRAYPVLYLLDGDAHFHSVTGLLQILGTGVNGTFAIPEMIVVAIPNTDRMRDLTPTRVEKDFSGKADPSLKNAGGMPNFLQFIKTELIPRIDKTYRTAPYRVFVGHSLGGITTIDALYTMPETFNAYVAIDPSLWYDDRILLKQAREHVNKPGLASRTLYVAQANTINAADTSFNIHFNAIAQFNGVLESYNTSGLRYGFKYYGADDHGSVPLIAEYDALRFIFDGYKGDLTKALEDPGYVTSHYAKVSAMLGYTMLPPESIVDFLGQVQMTRDSTKAMALLQLNAQLYPDSPKAHLSLGDAWSARGEKVKAMAAFERSLALRSKNPHATEMIRKLKEGQ